MRFDTRAEGTAALLSTECKCANMARDEATQSLPACLKARDFRLSHSLFRHLCKCKTGPKPQSISLAVVADSQGQKSSRSQLQVAQMLIFNLSLLNSVCGVTALWAYIFSALLCTAGSLALGRPAPGLAYLSPSHPSGISLELCLSDGLQSRLAMNDSSKKQSPLAVSSSSTFNFFVSFPRTSTLARPKPVLKHLFASSS